MLTIHPQYITDPAGKKLVALPVNEFNTIMEELEEMEDIRIYDEAKKDDNGERMLFTGYLKNEENLINVKMTNQQKKPLYMRKAERREIFEKIFSMGSGDSHPFETDNINAFKTSFYRVLFHWNFENIDEKKFSFEKTEEGYIAWRVQ